MWLALKYQKAPVPGMCSSVLGSPGKACARLAQVGARPAVSPRTWGGRSGRADLGDRLPPPTFCPCCRRPVLVALGCGEGPRGGAGWVRRDHIRAHGRAFRTPCLGVALTTGGTGRPGVPVSPSGKWGYGGAQGVVRVGQRTTHAPPRDEPGTGDRGFCAQMARPERGPATGHRGPGPAPPRPHPRPRPSPSQVGARRPRGGSRRGHCLALGKVPADIFLLKTKPMSLVLI